MSALKAQFQQKMFCEKSPLPQGRGLFVFDEMCNNGTIAARRSLLSAANGCTHIEHFVTELAPLAANGCEHISVYMIIESNIPLSNYTTFKIGGTADFFCIARTESDIDTALAFVRDKNIPLRVIGGGSNVLIPGEGLRGLTMQLALNGRTFTDRGGVVLAHIAAGEIWDEFVRDAVKRGLWGVENMSAIPGTVGAAPIQNIGAYGLEVKDRIEWVQTIDMRTGERRAFSNAACRFAYRDSFFKTDEGKHFIITSVAFLLEKHGAPRLEYRDLAEWFKNDSLEPTLANIREAVCAIRARKFPDLAVYGTAGSFFKNPIIAVGHYEQLAQRFSGVPCFFVGDGLVKIPAGWLIEHVGGFRGVRHGNVGSFQNQALVVVNYGGASADEVIAFAALIRDKIKKETGIVLELEVQLLK